ncbi:MAG: DUF2808 domain-containing protein [Synechococcaceae cyanobacterium SM2_3_1]|nr:DUF2808 domain-containing protein [Synechococcaceae cyanobacterium SM2_3_1]
MWLKKRTCGGCDPQSRRLSWILSLIAVTAASPVMAQSGLILTGSDEVPVLNYKLDFDGVERRLDRWRLNIPAQDVAVAEVQMSCESRFDGNVDLDDIRLEVEGQPVPLYDTFWNEEFKSLEVQIEAPVAAGQEMRLILSNVRNPTAGFYRCDGRLLGTEANPLYRYIGNWIVTINSRRDE